MANKQLPTPCIATKKLLIQNLYLKPTRLNNTFFAFLLRPFFPYLSFFTCLCSLPFLYFFRPFCIQTVGVFTCN